MLVTIYITIADYWKLKKGDILKFHSRKVYFEKIVNKWIISKIGMLKFTEVTLTDIDRIIHDIYDSGEAQYMVSWVCTFLRKIFHEAAIDRLIKDDICDGLKPVVQRAHERRVFNMEEEKRLLQAFQKTTQPELFTISMLTGTLYSELIKCEISDYSAFDKTLIISKKHKIVSAVNATYEMKNRLIPLSDISCLVLNEAVSKQRQKNIKFGDNKSNLIFTNKFNNQIWGISPKNYAIIRKESGIYDFMMKDLVSNFGINAIKNKVNPAALKRYMGYECESSISNLSIACHNKNAVKDITSCDIFYRKLIGENVNE